MGKWYGKYDSWLFMTKFNEPSEHAKGLNEFQIDYEHRAAFIGNIAYGLYMLHASSLSASSVECDNEGNKFRKYSFESIFPQKLYFKALQMFTNNMDDEFTTLILNEGKRRGYADAVRKCVQIVDEENENISASHEAIIDGERQLLYKDFTFEELERVNNANAKLSPFFKQNYEKMLEERKDNPITVKELGEFLTAFSDFADGLWSHWGVMEEDRPGQLWFECNNYVLHQYYRFGDDGDNKETHPLFEPDTVEVRHYSYFTKSAICKEEITDCEMMRRLFPDLA